VDTCKVFVGPDPCHEDEGPGPKGVLCPIQKYSGIAYLVEHPILWFYKSLDKDIIRLLIKIIVGPDPCHEDEGPGPICVLCPIQKYSGIAYIVEHPILWFYKCLDKDIVRLFSAFPTIKLFCSAFFYYI